jgi:lysophospholipase L1-like esterase
MALGDSITQADKDHLGYRYRLWVDLTADGKPFGFVGSMTTHYSGTPTYPNASYDRDHEGHWGWRADELLRDLPTWLRGYTPDIVLMHVGSNDAFQSNSTDSTVSELKAIIAALRADNPSVVVLLAKLIPATDSGRNQRVNELNARIPGIVSELSTQASPLILVDQNSGFSANSDTYDGVHPNEAGEQKMANRWREALLPLLANARGCD